MSRIFLSRKRANRRHRNRQNKKTAKEPQARGEFMEHQGELFQRNYKKNRNGGFSLIEVLIAVVVLAIVAIPMIHLFLTSTKLPI